MDGKEKIYFLVNRIAEKSEITLPGRITQADYDKKRAKWRAEQKQYERKLSKLSKADEQYYITVAYLLEIAARGRELFVSSNPDEKRELIGLLGRDKPLQAIQ